MNKLLLPAALSAAVLCAGTANATVIHERSFTLDETNHRSVSTGGSIRTGAVVLCETGLAQNGHACAGQISDIVTFVRHGEDDSFRHDDEEQNVVATLYSDTGEPIPADVGFANISLTGNVVYMLETAIGDGWFGAIYAPNSDQPGSASGWRTTYTIRSDRSADEVPEPSTALLTAFGLLAGWMFAGRKRA